MPAPTQIPGANKAMADMKNTNMQQSKDQAKDQSMHQSKDITDNKPTTGDASNMDDSDAGQKMPDVTGALKAAMNSALNNPDNSDEAKKSAEQM